MSAKIYPMKVIALSKRRNSLGCWLVILFSGPDREYIEVEGDYGNALSFCENLASRLNARFGPHGRFGAVEVRT